MGIKTEDKFYFSCDLLVSRPIEELFIPFGNYNLDKDSMKCFSEDNFENQMDEEKSHGLHQKPCMVKLKDGIPRRHRPLACKRF